MSKEKRAYGTDGPMMRAYCEAIEKLHDYCEEKEKNFRQTMIKAVEAEIAKDSPKEKE